MKVRFSVEWAVIRYRYAKLWILTIFFRPRCKILDIAALGFNPQYELNNLGAIFQCKLVTYFSFVLTWVILGKNHIERNRSGRESPE